MHYATIGAIQGAVVGIMLGSLATWILNAKSPLFNGLTVPGKVFFVSAFALSGFSIGGEKALLKSIRSPPQQA